MTLVGIAINKDGVVYFADGANIRTIDVNRKIETIIGSQGQPKYWQPLPCNKIISASEVTRFSKLFFFPERSLANCSWSWVSIPPKSMMHIFIMMHLCIMLYTHALDAPVLGRSVQCNCRLSMAIF